MTHALKSAAESSDDAKSEYIISEGGSNVYADFTSDHLRPADANDDHNSATDLIASAAAAAAEAEPADAADAIAVA